MDRKNLTGLYFWQGNTACAEGAIAAGCRFFAGYPITPSLEIMVHMNSRLPELNGICIQMEDEIASMAAVLGSSWAGRKAMTATSGPGFSLMLENIGLAIMTETPCVVVNVQRGGPSTGLPTFYSQSDIMQARWGAHGDYEIIALCPNSPQECFDLTIKAFNLSEQYRVPVIILIDGFIAHMMEKVTVPDDNSIQIVSRNQPKQLADIPVDSKPDNLLVPPMANFGQGYRTHTTGLTHDEHGYPDISTEAQNKLISRLIDKIKLNSDKIVITEQTCLDDADIAVISYGINSRTAVEAVKRARKNNVKAGHLRLVSLWPFPEKKIRELSNQAKKIIVPETNMGQIVREVQRFADSNTQIAPLNNAGGEIITADKILKTIMS
ncbi:2-oxoacid:acceptor oxidoreductase subunit alpha [bacterium]|nr:2-oxoacid:acceptor oxidoreductase subunit alpha [bacterium]